MGMFDTVQAVGYVHGDFRHSGRVFQTKDLACELNHYVLFGGALYLIDSDGDALHQPLAVEHDGNLRIYGDLDDGRRELWVEYDLELERGRVVGAIEAELSVQGGIGDLETRVPARASGKATVTVSYDTADCEGFRHFNADLDATLARLREICGDRDATVIHPVLDTHERLGGRAGLRTVWSVVQRASDFSFRDGDAVTATDETGNRTTVYTDESWRWFEDDR